MTTLILTLSGPAWRQILLTLAHSLWQGAALALLLAVVLARIAGNRPQARYLTSLVALAALVVSSLVTWSVLDLPSVQSMATGEASARSVPMAGGVKAQSTFAGPARSISKSRRDTRPVAASPAGESGFQSAVAAICSAAWLAGMLAMLARMAWLVTGARRLTARPPLTDGRVLELVETLRGRLGISRSIRVVDSANIGPAVLGILRPVLLLPAAIVSELPADCLEAILAHELAHIRRHDYLVNLVQMLVEAALFFNPAVWWISRQIRREREACCDALAVGMTGRPLTYAEALAAWLERLQTDRFAQAQATAGWLGQGQRGGALDRIRRLVVAGYRPELRGSWMTLAAGLAMSLLVLAALLSGTRASVVLADEILSPAQRIEQLAKERDELQPMDSPNGKATLAGTIRTADGKPVPQRLDGNLCTQNGRSSASKSLNLSGPNFSIEVDAGKASLTVSADGYAPLFLDGMQIKPGEKRSGIEIVLQPGFNASVRAVDPAGAPVAGATASAALSDPIGSRIWDWKSGDNGMIVGEHLGDVGYRLTVSAAGFQTLRTDRLQFKPDETVTLTLTPAAATRGIVVTPEDQPIAGAILRFVARLGGSGNASETASNGRGPVLTTTDSTGQFTLGDLSDDLQYSILVETANNGRRFFRTFTQASRTYVRVIGPDFVVNGRILGDLSQLRSAGGLRKIDFDQTVSVSPRENVQHNFGLIQGNAAVTRIDGEGRFSLRNLVPGRLSLTVGSRTVQVILENPTTDVTVDLNEKPPAAPPTRHVVLRFVDADPGLAPMGQVRIVMSKSGPTLSEQLDVAIKDGKAEFDAYVPGKFVYEMKNVVGYWFQAEVVDVPAGTEPLEHEISVVAAGAVRGHVLNADGTPFTGNPRVGARSIEKPPTVNVEPIAIDNVPLDASGSFFISPLPLDGVYFVTASRGYEVAASEPVSIDASHPTPTVELQFSSTQNASGRVVGPDGKPLSGIPVGLVLRLPKGGTNFNPPNLTDRSGRFEFKGLSTGIGKYWVGIAPRRDFQPAEVLLPLDGSPVDVSLAAGHVIDGQLLDAATGKPLVGIQVFAHPFPWSPQVAHRYETETPATDAEGRFRFSTLPAGSYSLQVYMVGVPFSFHDPEKAVHTGETIDLRVKVPKTE